MSSPTTGRRVLVTGGGAVGKSTVCRLVAQSLPRSTVIEADVVRESILGGFAAPDLSWPDPFDDWFLENLDELFILAESWNSHPAWSGWTIIDTTDMTPTDVAARILEQL